MISKDTENFKEATTFQSVSAVEISNYEAWVLIVMEMLLRDLQSQQSHRQFSDWKLLYVTNSIMLTHVDHSKMYPFFSSFLAG